jgi:hypothetical protein
MKKLLQEHARVELERLLLPPGCVEYALRLYQETPLPLAECSRRALIEYQAPR